MSIIVKLLPIDKALDSLSKDQIINPSIPDPINDISTNPSSKNNYKKKLFDQAIPIDVKRIKEEKDILKISEDSSVVPKENSNEDI